MKFILNESIGDAITKIKEYDPNAIIKMSADGTLLKVNNI